MDFLKNYKRILNLFGFRIQLNNLKFFCLLILLFLINSCGYKKPEEDKFPDLPTFPKHTNQKIEIVNFPYVTGKIYYNDFYFFTKIDYDSPL